MKKEVRLPSNNAAAPLSVFSELVCRRLLLSRRSFHKARRFEMSRMLSLQRLIASLWYRVWLPVKEDQATVVSPALPPAGCNMYPRRGNSSKASVKTCKALRLREEVQTS